MADPEQDPEQARLRLTIYLGEYRMLKHEQISRIGIRDNLIYVALAATATVVAYSFSKDASPLALLALPVANFVLGYLHTSNDAKSCALGRYLQHVLSERMLQVARYPHLSDENPCILGWESEVRTVPLRPLRKLTELASALVTFVVPGVLALLTCWLWLPEERRPPFAVRLPATIVEGGLLAVLCFWILKGSDICWKHSADVDT